MTHFSKTLLAVAASIAAMTSAAHAGVYGISVFNTSNSIGPGNPIEHALPGANSIFNAGDQIYTGSFTGPVDFNVPSGGANTVAAFLASGGDSFSAPISGLTQTLSGTAATYTTGVILTFTTSYVETLSVVHDDGVSLFGSGGDLFAKTSAAPTFAATDTATIGPGSYTLYYIETNGLPADLDVTVPEPASFALLGAGLLGVGMIRRRKSGQG